MPPLPPLRRPAKKHSFFIQTTELSQEAGYFNMSHPTLQLCFSHWQGRRQVGWGWGWTPLELDILNKLYYLRTADQFHSHTFCLLICRLIANTTEWIRMQLSRNIANGPKSNNYVLVGIWVIFCIEKASHHFLQTFRPLRMFKIVFRDSSLYPKQSRAYAREVGLSPTWAWYFTKTLLPAQRVLIIFAYLLLDNFST